MPGRIFRFYQRYRILNVNLNIILAGMLAILVAKWPVQWVSDWIGEGPKILKLLSASVIDGIADFLIYFLLHWVANHWRPLKTRCKHEQAILDRRKGSFFKHATVIQVERYTLFPIFQLVGMGGMALLMSSGMREGWAFALGFTAAILTTRVLHTAYWLKTGKFNEDYLEPTARDADSEESDDDGLEYASAGLAEAIARANEDDRSADQRTPTADQQRAP